jgi:hypothetical protein
VLVMPLRRRRAGDMLRALPPMYVPSTSTSPPSLPPPPFPSCIARRMQWRMNHAVFCVTRSERASSCDDTPFLEFANIHTAGSHLSRPSGESS